MDRPFDILNVVLHRVSRLRSTSARIHGECSDYIVLHLLIICKPVLPVDLCIFHLCRFGRSVSPISCCDQADACCSRSYSLIVSVWMRAIVLFKFVVHSTQLRRTLARIPHWLRQWGWRLCVDYMAAMSMALVPTCLRERLLPRRSTLQHMDTVEKTGQGQISVSERCTMCIFARGGTT